MSAAKVFMSGARIISRDPIGPAVRGTVGPSEDEGL